MITTQFHKMGARVVDIADPSLSIDQVAVNIRKDSGGEFFSVNRGLGTSAEVIDSQPKSRHLLLMIRKSDGEKQKYLCG